MLRSCGVSDPSTVPSTLTATAAWRPATRPARSPASGRATSAQARSITPASWVHRGAGCAWRPMVSRPLNRLPRRPARREQTRCGQQGLGPIRTRRRGPGHGASSDAANIIVNVRALRTDPRSRCSSPHSTSRYPPVVAGGFDGSRMSLPLMVRRDDRDLTDGPRHQREPLGSEPGTTFMPMRSANLAHVRGATTPAPVAADRPVVVIGGSFVIP